MIYAHPNTFPLVEGGGFGEPGVPMSTLGRGLSVLQVQSGQQVFERFSLLWPRTWAGECFRRPPRFGVRDIRVISRNVGVCEEDDKLHLLLDFEAVLFERVIESATGRLSFIRSLGREDVAPNDGTVRIEERQHSTLVRWVPGCRSGKKSKDNSRWPATRPEGYSRIP